ncbi:hypothetical protein H4Q26_006255 [Puccinia striiformis f. sp. tritici PST-130]|nr:hypothetical protein H4Q26_006255 [Puccinia striiformis f. sp. tritici PST-130]
MERLEGETEVEPVRTLEQRSFLRAFLKLTGKLQRNMTPLSATSRRRKRMSPQASNHVDRIKTILLPALPGKICQLCDLLFNPQFFRELDAQQLQAGVQLLTEFEDILDQLISSMASFWEEDLYGFHLEYGSGMKRYRCGRIQAWISDIFKQLEQQLHIYTTLVPLPELIVVPSQTVTATWRELAEYTHSTRLAIDDLVELWFDESDLVIIEDHCAEMAGQLGDLLEECVGYPSLHPDLRSEPFRDFIPIIKLSRLFFNKMSKPTSDGHHPITQMTTEQLLTLVNGTSPLYEDLEKFYDSNLCALQDQRSLYSGVARDLLLSIEIISGAKLDLKAKFMKLLADQKGPQ